jgi:dTDP-4-amino-4,6-dideoxygalactose transaminase
MNKLLVTGEGGMVLSDNEEVLKKVKSLSYYGIADSSTTGFDKSGSGGIWWEIKTSVPSLKLNMNNIAASLGLTQLKKMDGIMQKRGKVADNYYSALRPLESRGLLQLPPEYPEVENNVYLFWLFVKDEATRNQLAKFLLASNIYSTVKYQPLDKRAETPMAFRFYRRALNIPFNQNLTQTQQKYIIKKIKEFFKDEK